jgi:GGDEF domain-containing protein
MLIVATISILLIMVFENQLDLIADNAVLESRVLGSRLSSTLVGTELSDVDDAFLDSFRIQRLIVFSDTGDTIARIRGDGETAHPEDLRNISMAIARRDFENRSFYLDLDYDARRVSLYVPVRSTVDRPLVARADIPLDSIDRPLDRLYRQVLIVVVLVVVFHVMYALYLDRTILRPMRRIMIATENVSRGNLGVRVPVVRPNELGRFATAFNEMSVAVSRMRDEALQSNPLSGLPGNPAIIAEIESRLGRAIALLYVDLNEFKAYNDHYGFTRGDQALLYTRDCLVDASAAFSDTFLGHEGGDDFVLVTREEHAEPLARAIVDRFERDRRSLFSDTDWRHGYISALDRQGREHLFSLLSVSVAVVIDSESRYSTSGELIAGIAGVKKRAKNQEGSAYVIDRRGGEERD